MAIAELTPELRLAWLPEAEAAAKAAKDSSLAAQWGGELAELRSGKK